MSTLECDWFFPDVNNSLLQIWPSKTFKTHPDNRIFKKITFWIFFSEWEHLKCFPYFSFSICRKSFFPTLGRLPFYEEIKSGRLSTWRLRIGKAFDHSNFLLNRFQSLFSRLPSYENKIFQNLNFSGKMCMKYPKQCLCWRLGGAKAPPSEPPNHPTHIANLQSGKLRSRFSLPLNLYWFKHVWSLSGWIISKRG